MNNNTLPLVTYEQARRLKNAGFDWPTVYWFNDKGKQGCWGVPHARRYDEEHLISAPTVALALKWMRDVKHFRLCVKWLDLWQCYIGAWFCRENAICTTQGIQATTARFPTYEAAESALLDELLKIIENGKE